VDDGGHPSWTNDQQGSLPLPAGTPEAPEYAPPSSHCHAQEFRFDYVSGKYGSVSVFCSGGFSFEAPKA